MGAKCVFTKQHPTEIEIIRKYGVHSNKPTVRPIFAKTLLACMSGATWTACWVGRTAGICTAHASLFACLFADWCTSMNVEGPISIVMYKTAFGIRKSTSTDKLKSNNGKIQTTGQFDAYFIKDEHCLVKCQSDKYYESIVSR